MSILSEQSIVWQVTDTAQWFPEDQPLASLSAQGLTPSQQPQDTLGEWVASPADQMSADLNPILLEPNDASAANHSAAEYQGQQLQALAQHPSLYSGKLTEAAAVITQTLAGVLRADRVSLWLYLSETQIKQIDSYDRSRDAHVKGTVLATDDFSAYFEPLRDRPGLAINNVIEAVPQVGCLAQHSLIFHQPGALLEIPVRLQGKVVGVLWCESLAARCWSALDQSIVLSGALLAATAIGTQQQRAISTALTNHKRQLKRETIEREQAEQAWQESQRFIQGIIDASTNILYVDSFADGSNIYISRWIKNVLGYEAAEVQAMGPQYLEQLIHADEKSQMSAERRKLAAINDGEVVENEYRFRHRNGPWRWLLCRETVFHRDEEGRPTQVFGTATDITKRKHAEVALQEFNRELKRLAHMDGLTQVANRRSFDEYLEQEWKNVGSGRSSLSLILCDIDYFKSFNDTYGHQAGDVCLRQVAQAIERAVKRSNDLVARYGGEEFAVILPNTSYAGVEQVAIEIQREIQQLEISHSQSEVSTYITLSLGLACVSSTQNIYPDMLVAAADQGLYKAKYEGRNRFCIGAIDSE